MGYDQAVQVRKNQIDQMCLLRKEKSYRSMRNQLRKSSPDATRGFDDNSLLVLIRSAATKAESYGIMSGESVTTFVKLAVFAGLSFDEHPSVAQFLRMPELDPDYKVKLLAQLVAEKLNATVSD